MPAGKQLENKDLIVEAIAEAEAGTTGEIRVHLSHKLLEADAMKSARKLFLKQEMHRNSRRNGVLLYVNLRKRKLAVVGDEGIHQRVGQAFWDRLAADLKEDLKSTHPENAIALAVVRLGEELTRYFPSEEGKRLVRTPRASTVSNEVTED